jgi:predicted metalloprotease
MKWKGNRASTNVDDARGRRVIAGSGGGAAGLLLNLVGRRFGIKGILVLVVLGVVLWKAGLMDPAQMLGGSAQTQSVPYQPTAEEQERFDFVTVVLGYTEDVWKAEFARHNATYQEPTLVIYTGQEPTACGMGSAQMGPFYCPADRKVYIDLSFYDELERSFDAPGDFAQAYVIAHEIGHHVQKLLGTSDKVHAMQGRPDYNEYSVRLELQADYYAGVWANHTRQYQDRGDIEEAMRAANAIGDDAIQARTQGKIVPHAFTHGTSEQRMHWFNKGLQSGRIEDGDTFSMPYEDL